jgi:hypothetical protein
MLGFAQAMISILRKDLVAYYCGSVAACSTFDLLSVGVLTSLVPARLLVTLTGSHKTPVLFRRRD